MIRILVIDDDRHMRTACSRVLTKTGWEVICAETGDEGLSAIRDGANRIDAVLIDCLMPGGMSGMEFLAHARELAPNLPVILMTGSATKESVAQAKKAGAYDCLAKPFIPDQLREVLKNAVNICLSTGE
jgi:DNA-binding NtrC family response regulator